MKMFSRSFSYLELEKNTITTTCDVNFFYSLSFSLLDLKTALIRYIKNNFSDGFRQDSIDLVLGHYKVDVHSGPTYINVKKNIFYLPLVFLMTLAFGLLITLLYSESDSEYFLITICIFSTAIFLALIMCRHSRAYVDFPKYCTYELTDNFKIN